MPTQLARLLVLSALLLLAVAAPAAAKGGALDPSFGNGGKVERENQWGGSESGFVGLAQGRDGKTYALTRLNGEGRYAVLGLGANGKPDASFGNHGTVLLDPAILPSPRSLAVDASGRVILAGSTGVNLPAPPDYRPPRFSKLVVIRLLPDGGLDTSFAEGGHLVTDLGFAPAIDLAWSLSGPAVEPRYVATDQLGRIVVTGWRGVSVTTEKNSSSRTFVYEGFAARLEPNGALDHSYGNGGIALGLGYGQTGSTSFAEDGSFFLAAHAYSGTPYVIKVDASGHPDPGFGEAGWRLSPALATAPVLLADGRGGVVVSQAPAKGELALRRLLADGRMDRTFGRRGVLGAKFGRASERWIGPLTAIAGDRRGGLFLALPGQQPGERPEQFREGFLLAHVTASGELDREFGRVWTGFGIRGRARPEAIVVDGRGRPLLAGRLESPRLPGGFGLTLTRYQAAR